MKYLIDSDYAADYLKGRTAAVTLLDDFFPQGLAISIITFAEVYEGIYYGHNPQHYKTIFRNFLRGVTVLGINRSIAYKYAVVAGDLRARGQLIPPTDLFIGTTAIYHNLALVTRNIRHFRRIPNLSLYQSS